ncbi:MAG: polysaccharide biosynthesis/export family protein [Bacillota bacterium]|jgi:polysaccharide export outer membrane protein|nr:polysaccharide biosynthesis/export family protein [Bacillota bacterium]
MKPYAALLLILTGTAPAQTFVNKAAPDVQAGAHKVVNDAADPAYVIGADDVLAVTVWKEPELSATVPVRSDGKISLPLLNDVQAAGLTPSQLAADVSEKVKKFITDPSVTVIVTQMNSRKAYIMGLVNHQGMVRLQANMTVLQALSAAGGLAPFANRKKIYVLRSENGQEQKLPFNYDSVIKGKNVEQNVLLKPGDTVVVP